MVNDDIISKHIFMIDVLLASLIDAIKTRQDLRTGNSSLQEVKDSASRFNLSLIKFIDQRIDSNINERNKFKSQERASIKSLTALNSAPPPLEEADLEDISFVKEWFVQYKHWYNTKRKSVLSTG